jgi:uncharacterized cupin superfamily protein
MGVVRRFNVFSGELDLESTREGYSWRRARVSDRLGGERPGGDRIGASVYELGEDEQTFPYHFHHGVEEWLYVIEGEPTVRTPHGSSTLRAGELICFPAGPDGAHGVRGPGRVLLFSANREPSISVYPDSDKVGPRPGDGAERLDFRRGDAVDYWDGE